MDFHTLLQTLEQREPLAPLCPNGGVYDQTLVEQIANASAQQISGQSNPSELAQICCRSLFHLWNDDLDRSHQLSQNVQEPLGSYLHGMMHRREGDFSNAKFWFSKAGATEAIDGPMYDQGKTIWPEIFAWKQWDSLKFVDAVAEAVAKEEQEEQLATLRQMQTLEFRIVLQVSVIL